MNIQILAYVFGTGLLAVSAHANITWAHGGHYTSAGGLITIGLAAGIGIGAITSGRAWSDKRYTAAIIIAFAVLICEGFGKRLTGLASASEVEVRAAVALIPTLAGPSRRVLKIESYNGAATLATPAEPWLAEAGFVRDPPGMAYYAGW